MDILRDFLDNSTIHGLAYISNGPSKAGKALWLTIVLAGFCTAGYLINTSYKEWETTPVATSISTHPIATLPLPIITICPPEQSNTALNVDLVRAGNISLTDEDRQALINISRQFFIHEPSQNFVKLARSLTNKEAIDKLSAKTRSYPTPHDNRDFAFEIWSTELAGSYKSPGFGAKRNCSTQDPDIHFTLYFPHKFGANKGDLTNETLNIDIVALNDGEFDVEYREGDKYTFHGESHEIKNWNDAENHCNEQKGHLVSIRTNYDFYIFRHYQIQKNTKGKNVWLGGSDERIESIWEWSDGTPWANESVALCSKIRDIQKFGLQTCTNWGTEQPTGGREKNCLGVDQYHIWRSDYCTSKKKNYWCHFPTKRLTSHKKLSWGLANITFSKIELWFSKKRLEGAKTCNRSSEMPGFSVTWSTQSSGGSNTNKVLTVPDILADEKLAYEKMKVESVFGSLTSLKYTILSCREMNMATEEIWNMVKIHKRELIEDNRIGCYQGQVKRDDYRKLFSDLRQKIPRDRPEVAYNETADDHSLAFEILSYLLVCKREQIEMAAFFNNLFHTGNPRTILQATVNNIQIGVEEADTMVALHQIYTMLARKMDLKLPNILQGFFDSKMLHNVDQNGDMFMNKHLKEDSKPMEILQKG